MNAHDIIGAAFKLPPHDQFLIAAQVAENVGYTLTPDLGAEGFDISGAIASAQCHVPVYDAVPRFEPDDLCTCGYADPWDCHTVECPARYHPVRDYKRPGLLRRIIKRIFG